MPRTARKHVSFRVWLAEGDPPSVAADLTRRSAGITITGNDPVIEGEYVTHGSGLARDLRRFLDGRSVDLEVTREEPDPCLDPACAGCDRLRGPRFVDCQGLGGFGTTLGAVRAGFQLVHRVTLPGGFGDVLVEANRHLLPGDWRVEVDEWTPQERVAYLAGVPPCSGFSIMNALNPTRIARYGMTRTGNMRGPGSNINMCQRELVRYAGRCTGRDGESGPEVVAFESVQGAYSQGRALMVEYRDLLRAATDQPYVLTHVKLNNAGLGNPQLRSRYLWVAHRIPFGVEVPHVPEVNVWDALSDLTLLDAHTWGEQELRPPESAYQVSLRRSDGKVDAHTIGPENRKVRAVQKVFDSGVKWDFGENVERPVQRYVERFGEDVDHIFRWDHDTDGIHRQVFRSFLPFRLDPAGHSHVVHGDSAMVLIHPTEPRFLTVRELARLMGIPDAWRFDVARNAQQAGAWIGKNCPTQAGEWLGRWVRAALNGEPGSLGTTAQPGHRVGRRVVYEELAEGERLVDVTHAWREAQG